MNPLLGVVSLSSSSPPFLPSSSSLPLLNCAGLFLAFALLAIYFRIGYRDRFGHPPPPNLAINAAGATSQLPPRPLRPHRPFPLSKMALDQQEKLQDPTTKEQKKDVSSDLKQPLPSDIDNADLEGAAPYGISDRSVGGRIAPVLPHLAGYDFGNDDTGSDILGKQIELEAGNDIQYRTCSWPKVSVARRFLLQLRYATKKCDRGTSSCFPLLPDHFPTERMRKERGRKKFKNACLLGFC